MKYTLRGSMNSDAKNAVNTELSLTSLSDVPLILLCGDDPVDS
jgi:hypothetical protein